MAERDKEMRLFVGAAISAECADKLRQRATELADRAAGRDLKLRWVAPDNYHVTVKYLGWSKPGALYAIRDAVAEAIADARRFEFRPAGLGAFPEISRARVLWAGLEDQSDLEALAAAVEGAVEPLGFAPEKRPYHAHITLARLKKVADLSTLVAGSEQTYSDTRCKSLNLYESVNTSEGTSYEVRWTWPLGGGRASER